MYDLISISEIHREILYALFKKEIVLTNMFAAIFSEKLRCIKECDAITFYRYEKLRKELLDECINLYITPMIDGWEIKRTLVYNGSTINVCCHKFLLQLYGKGV